MASKLGGHSLIHDPPLRKVGGPLTPGPSRIAATGAPCWYDVIHVLERYKFHDVASTCNWDQCLSHLERQIAFNEDTERTIVWH